MNQQNVNQILWENVAVLMKMRYGKENMGKLAVDAGVGPATMTRIKEQVTSIGTEKLEQIAKALGVQSWQLLCPNYDFARKSGGETKQHPPVLEGRDLQALFDRIPLSAPTREPAYNECFDILMTARRQAANLPTPEPAQALNQEKRTA